MIKVSGGYVAINPNYVITDIQKKNTIDEKTHGLVAIVKNIIFRGAPTKPSLYLTGKIGDDTRTNGYKYTAYTQKLQWERKIKGGISNPALSFYEKMWKEIPAIASTILPECPLNQIVYKDNMPDRYAIDFYSPFYALSIEIDGPHHDEKLKQISDDERDNLILKACARKPLRIKVSDISTSIDEKINEIRNTYDVPQKQLISVNDISVSHKIYMYVIRYQTVLLALIENGYLNFVTDNFKINLIAPEQDKDLSQSAFKLAYEDLKLWFSQLYSLLNEECVFPTIEISPDATIIVDVDPYNRYDDNFFSNNNTIYVRNDYFRYDKDSFAKTQQEHEQIEKYVPTTYCGSKNYYSVASSDLRFTEVSPYNPKHKESLKFFLNNIFRHEDFRPKQLEIISYGLDPKNGVVGLLPTGSGKSVCYQLISFLTPGTTLVIAPLKLLMDDQKQNLFKRNLIMTAYQIHGEQYLNKVVAENNQAKLLYISPERFFDEKFDSVLQNLTIAQIAIDEVHCLSEWGHDFRTSYLLLLSFLKKYPDNTLLMGTSATASPNVINDIEKEFSKIKPNNFKKIQADSVKRPELTFSVEKVSGQTEAEEKLREIVDSYKKQNRKTLIFSAYTKTADDISSEILSGHNVKVYHGKVDEESKKNAFDSFAKGSSIIMSATKAFGMGVDINDIHATIHYDIASSIESLYQEMGRAGRDQNQSICKIILNESTNEAKVTKELFNHPFDIGMLKKDNEKSKFISKYPAVGKQLSLMMGGNLKDDVWADSVYEVYTFLKREDTSNQLKHYEILNNCPSFDSLYNKSAGVQKALYKLYTLGVIDLWGMSYSEDFGNPLYTKLNIKEISLSDVKSNMESHIRKYDYKYSYTGELTLEAMINALCKWDNDTFLRYRWESLKTLYKMLSEFKDSETFANRIDAFFSTSESIDSIIRNPNSKYDEWLSVLFENTSSVLSDQLLKYSAEMQNNNTLDFLQGILAFKEGAPNKSTVKKITNIIKQIPTTETNHLLALCLQYFSEDTESQKRFIIFLADHFPKSLKRKEIKDIINNHGNDLKTQISSRVQYNEIYSSLNKLKKTLGEF